MASNEMAQGYENWFIEAIQQIPDADTREKLLADKAGLTVQQVAEIRKTQEVSLSDEYIVGLGQFLNGREWKKGGLKLVMSEYAASLYRR